MLLALLPESAQPLRLLESDDFGLVMSVMALRLEVSEGIPVLASTFGGIGRDPCLGSTFDIKLRDGDPDDASDPGLDLDGEVILDEELTLDEEVVGKLPSEGKEREAGLEPLFGELELPLLEIPTDGRLLEPDGFDPDGT